MLVTLKCLQNEEETLTKLIWRVSIISVKGLRLILDDSSWSLSLGYYKSPKNNENYWHLFLVIILIKGDFTIYLLNQRL